MTGHDNNTDMMRENEAAIREFLKQVSEKNTFSVSGIAARQQRVVRALRKQGWKNRQIFSALHAGWKTIDKDVRSAACLYEQYRMRIAVLGSVLPYLKQLDGEAYHVVLASPRWRRKKNDVASISAQTLKRKIRDGIEKLKRMGCKPVLFGAIELSAGIEQSGAFWWEPHLDFIVVGATRKQIAEAFAVRKSKADRKIKWLRIMEIDTNIGGHLDYGFKFKPELRRAFIGSTGRQHRSRDHLRGADGDRWTEWMAMQKMTDVNVHFGLPRWLVQIINSSELATLVEEIV